MQPRAGNLAMRDLQAFRADRHNKWNNGENRIRQYRRYVLFCTKWGLPKSECTLCYGDMPLNI
jgi:hypothetical protein